MHIIVKDDAEEKQMPGSTALFSDQLSDIALISAIATGAVWAVEQLYQRYNHLLYALTCQMVADPHVAEDLVQEVWLAVWRNARSYNPQSGAVRSWLFSIVHHRVIDYVRATRRRSALKQVPWEEVELDERTAFPDTWDEAWRSVQSAQVRAALMKLSPEQRLAIELAYLQGWTHAEIAEQCGLSLGTVKGRIRCGLLQLKREFERQGMYER
jgi:RNA polymerase sigma factor (sigma-70 family)